MPWINTPLANIFFGGVIVVNAAFLGVEADYRKNENSNIGENEMWFIIESVFLAIFSLELILRFQAERCRCLKDCWNIFDLSLVIMGILDTWIVLLLQTSSSNGMQMLTLLRVVR